VRELENAMQRAVILCENKTVIDHDLLSLNIDIDALNLAPELERGSGNIVSDITQSNRHGDSTDAIDAGEDLSLEDYFQRFVTENQELMSETELAKKLGVSRKCLWERRQRLGIPRKRSAFKK
jgi:DNA-binding NtrC family response regulator